MGSYMVSQSDKIGNNFVYISDIGMVSLQYGF